MLHTAGPGEKRKNERECVCASVHVHVHFSVSMCVSVCVRVFSHQDYSAWKEERLEEIEMEQLSFHFPF